MFKSKSKEWDSENALSEEFISISCIKLNANDIKYKHLMFK